MDREKIDYTVAVSQIQELAKIDAHYMPLLANVSALLNDMLSDVNWVGFYIMKNDSWFWDRSRENRLVSTLNRVKAFAALPFKTKRPSGWMMFINSRVTSLVIPPPVQNWLFRCSTGTPM